MKLILKRTNILGDQSHCKSPTINGDSYFFKIWFFSKDEHARKRVIFRRLTSIMAFIYKGFLKFSFLRKILVLVLNKICPNLGHVLNFRSLSCRINKSNAHSSFSVSDHMILKEDFAFSYLVCSWHPVPRYSLMCTFGSPGRRLCIRYLGCSSWLWNGT